MKTAEPKIIYLQIGDDADINEFTENDFETNAITWCWEKICDNDIEYISKAHLTGLIDEMIDGIKDSSNYADEFAYNLLTELKEKVGLK